MAVQRRRSGGGQGGPAAGCPKSFAGESCTPGRVYGCWAKQLV
jgi:hypothetical protein